MRPLLTSNMTDFLVEGVCTMGTCGLGNIAFPTVTAETLAEVVAAQQTTLSDILSADDLITIPEIW